MLYGLQIAFWSRWQRVTWTVAVLLFMAILVLTGAVDRLPSGVRYPLPAGTVRGSVAGRYVVVVVTPQLVLNLVAGQLARATLLAVLYGATISLAVAERRRDCPCRPLAASGIGAVVGALGLSFCCGPLVGALAALGLGTALNATLWVFSMALAVVTLVVLTLRMRSDGVSL